MATFSENLQRLLYSAVSLATLIRNVAIKMRYKFSEKVAIPPPITTQDLSIWNQMLYHYASQSNVENKILNYNNNNLITISALGVGISF